MPKFRVIKRVINDYRVTVEASSVGQARLKAVEGEHEPGERVNDYNDGEYFRALQWVVENEAGEKIS